MACSAAPRDSSFLDSTVCASCCARTESSRGGLRCRLLGSRSGVAMTHVRLRPHAMHRDQQLEQEVGLAKCSSVLPLTMCLLNFVVPASCSLSLLFSQVAQVVNVLSSFLPLPLVYGAGFFVCLLPLPPNLSRRIICPVPFFFLL